MSNKNSELIYKKCDEFYASLCNIATKGLYNLFYTWNRGCIYAWKNRDKRRVVLTSTFALCISIGVSVNSRNDIHQIISLAPCLSLLFLFGLIERFTNSQIEKKSKIFENIGLKAKNGDLPRIIKSQKAGKGREVLTIKSYIPFSTWLKNKEELEQLFNSTVAIKQTKNKQIIKIIKFGRIKNYEFK